jgi:ubiquinone/menaquinone biosynthesis C-methylase UbiE
MIEETLSEAEAQRFYDRYGKRLEWSDWFEGRAKGVAHGWASPEPGQRVLELGIGTGRFQELARQQLGSTGQALAVELSPTMLRLTGERLQRAGLSPAGLLRGSVIALPLASESFDWVFSSYTFDLLPLRSLRVALEEARRVLRPEGRLVVCSLTEGQTWLERLFMGSWKRIHALSPARVGGCRPLVLGPLLEEAGFAIERRQHVGQLGTPSEVLLAVPA